MDLCELKNRYEIELLSAIDTRQAFLNVPFQRVFNDAHQDGNDKDQYVPLFIKYG